MPIVSFSSDVSPVEVESNTQLLDALLARDVNAKMLCGRRGMCATCHVYIEEGMESLAPQTVREKQSLMLLTGASDRSRLACQAKIVGNSEVRVRLPEGLYVESLSELESYVGKRSSVPILHPITGDVLVEANKIIVRSMIMKLTDTDFQIEDLKAAEGPKAASGQ